MHSDEMKEWSVGGEYDRPIPRRIVEEAGIARESFGMKKMASSHTNLLEKEFLNARFWDEYTAFRRSLEEEMGTAKRNLLKAKHKLKNYICTRKNNEPKVRKMTWIQIKFPFLFNTYVVCDWDHSFIFQWAYHKLRPRYNQ